MKMIEDDGGIRKVLHHRAHVGGGHIDRDGFHRCPRMAKSFPERNECVSSLAVTDEYDGPAFEVEDHSNIGVALLHRDLIDGQIPEVLEGKPGKLLLEVPFLDILDDIPGDMEMAGHVEDGHVLREFEDIALEGTGIGETGIGKTEFHLADGIASPAGDALHIQAQKDCLRPYGNQPESSRRASSENKIPAPACRAMKPVSFMRDREDHLAFLICRLHICIADETESMIQKACGHASPPIVEMPGSFSL